MKSPAFILVRQDAALVWKDSMVDLISPIFRCRGYSCLVSTSAFVPRNEIQAMQLAIENRIEQGTNAILRRINAVLLTSLAIGGGLIAALVVS